MSPSAVNSESSNTSPSLLDRAKRRDPDAWQRLVRLYHPLIYYWCRSRGLEHEDAADVTQETFRSIARGLNDFHRLAPGSFRAWLRTITGNRLIDHFRRRRDEPVAHGGSDAQWRLNNAPDPAESMLEASGPADEKSIVMRQALALIECEFEQSTWQAFWQVTVLERRPADVAADLSISVNAVYKAKSRVLRRLRDNLRGFDE